MPKVAIIGAGLSGLSCARRLVEKGIDPLLFDKGRVPGGRVATRRAEGGLAFDHGAQYFTVQDSDVQPWLQRWLDQGVVAEWTGRVVRLETGIPTEIGPRVRYVGVPGMSALAKAMAEGLAIRSGIQIQRLEQSRAGWLATDSADATHGPFDQVLVALPSPQAAAVLGSDPFAERASMVAMSPCWASMVAFKRRVDFDWDAAFVHGSPLSWVCRDSSKPGRADFPDRWVLHASPDWSSENLERSPESVSVSLLSAFGAATGAKLPDVLHQASHRWRFSRGADPLEPMALHDPDRGLALAGDWMAGGRVEGAIRSGCAAARLLENLAKRGTL